MTTYKIYYKEKNLPKHGIWASQGAWFVEVPDEYGRKKAQIAREKFWEFVDKEKYEIVRVVKDC